MTRRPSARRWLLACAVAGLGCGPAGVFAQSTFLPYVGEAIEHNTNIFDLNKEGPAPQGKSGNTFDDTFSHARAGIDGTYLLGQQTFFGTAEYSRYDYDHFTDLDHNENLIDGGVKWKLARTMDGILEYDHAQRMVQFLDLAAATQLIIETENTATVSANFNVTPEWRLEDRFKDHNLDSPRTNIPGLSLHEDSLHEGFKYLGVSNLSAGIEAEYLKGTYHHDPLALNPDYHQVSVAAAATYIVSGYTNFNGDLGYTKRTDPSNVGLSGLTGAFGYQHSLTGKTTLNLQVSRAVNSYITTAGNELDTTGSIGVSWQATYKTMVRAGYAYTDSKYPRSPDGAIFIERVDHYQTANVEVEYQALNWLKIHPYLRYQTRSSNDSIYQFNGSVVGVELLVKRAVQPK